MEEAKFLKQYWITEKGIRNVTKNFTSFENGVLYAAKKRAHRKVYTQSTSINFTESIPEQVPKDFIFTMSWFTMSSKRKIDFFQRFTKAIEL